MSASRHEGIVAISSALVSHDSGTAVEHFAELTTALKTFVGNYGVFAVFVVVTLEALGAPLPGETLLIFASFLAGKGEISLPALLVFAWAGAVLGDNIGYIIGRFFGRKIVSRYGAKIGLTQTRMTKIESTFRRYGPGTVLFARFFAILRQLNGIVAGIVKMPWWLFLLANGAGAALWVATWVLAPAYFTEHRALIGQLARNNSPIIILTLVCLVGLSAFLLQRLARRHTP